MSSELNKQIAELRGWTQIETDPVDGKWNGVNPDSRTLELVAEPDTDPAACMELLQHILTLKLYDKYPLAIGDMDFAVHEKAWYVRLEAMQEIRVPFMDEAAMIGTGDNFYGGGDTLELAIATAARDALKSLRGDK